MSDKLKYWKVAIAGPSGIVYKDTNAFKLLYPFPTREEAEEHANCFRAAGKTIILCENPWG
jgi:hypothetical protein